MFGSIQLLTIFFSIVACLHFTKKMKNRKLLNLPQTVKVSPRYPTLLCFKYIRHEVTGHFSSILHLNPIPNISKSHLLSYRGGPFIRNHYFTKSQPPLPSFFVLIHVIFVKIFFGGEILNFSQIPICEIAKF